MQNKKKIKYFVLVLIFFGIVISGCSAVKNTTWSQTGGTFFGETGFTIDFGRDTFIATNGNVILTGELGNWGARNDYWISLDSSSRNRNSIPIPGSIMQSLTISGNAMLINEASFKKIEKNISARSSVNHSSDNIANANTSSGSSSFTESGNTLAFTTWIDSRSTRIDFNEDTFAISNLYGNISQGIYTVSGNTVTLTGIFPPGVMIGTRRGGGLEFNDVRLGNTRFTRQQ